VKVAELVEMRCAEHPHRMFGKLMQTAQATVVDGNLIEFSCPDCRKAAKLKPPVAVLHRFNLAGDLVETEIAYHHEQ
jgi:hypothetical protein